MRRGAIVLGIFVAIAACSPFGATADDASDVDGGQGIGDGGPPSTTGPDASEDAGTDGGSACSSEGHFLCEGFDAPFPWSGWAFEATAGSPVVADTEIHVSPPASLLVRVQPSPNTNHPSYVHRRLPAAQHVVVRADAAIGRSSLAPDGEIDILALEIVPPPTFERYFAAIIVTGDGRFVLETEVRTSVAGNTSDRKDLGDVHVGFTAIGLELNLDNGTVAAFVDAQQTSVLLVPAKSAGAELKVGAAWANNTKGTFSVNIDNLVVDQ